ncbi:MAG: hypothetical protein KJ666_02200 [Bacteroidetes bacterium]|nr:hypothetical protein [Bacteroidota bacterium]MBU2585129.1 hypothetical protein [Bacteroidota bacterium]
MISSKLIFITILIIISLPIFFVNENYYHKEFRDNLESVSTIYAYPPAVGILSSASNCLSCHSNNGPWEDDENLIIDILDKETKKSFIQNDGSFLIEVKRNKSKTVLTVLGRNKVENEDIPFRNAWLYIDTSTIAKNSLSKFAPDWDVNLPMSCRLIGDKLAGFEDADITSLPMTIQPLENANDAVIMLQAMLTKGESIKGKAKEGMMGNYFERKVKLKVID